MDLPDTPKHFRTHAACAAYLRGRLEGSAIEPEIANRMADELARSFAEPRAGRRGFSLVVGDYVVRDDDLKVFDAVRAALMAAAPVGFFTAQPTAAAIAGVVLAVFAVARQAYKRGARLTPLQLQVLLALRAEGRLRVEDLAARLALTADSSPWSAEDVQGELDSLRAIALRDGTVAALVAVDANDRWGAVDL